MVRVCAILGLVLLSRQTSAQPTPYSIQQYLDIRGASGPSLSPDGKEVAFRSSKSGTAQIWKCQTTGTLPDRLTSFASSVSACVWSPRGSSILAMVDTDGNEQFQFHLVDAKAETVVPLTEAPKVRHQFGAWSRDGRLISYSSNARDSRYFDVYTMEITTRSTRRVKTMDAVLGASVFSSNAQKLISTRAVSAEENDVFLIDLATGSSHQINPRDAPARFIPITFTLDGKGLIVITNYKRDLAVLARLDLQTQAVHRLFEAAHEVEAAVASTDGRRIAFSANVDGFSAVSIWDQTTERVLQTITHPQGVVTLGGFSSQSNDLALAISSPVFASDVFLARLSTGEVERVTSTSPGAIDPAAFVSPKLIQAPSHDGKQVPAFVYAPKEGSPANGMAIVSVHGGPESQERPSFNPIYQYFVNRGFTVIAPNIRGSSGYGKGYLALDNGPRRWDALKDLDAIAEYAVGKLGIAPNSIGIMGGSYGGFAVLAMLAHFPNRFAAGVDLFGIADFKTFLENTAPFRRPLRAVEYGDPVKDSEFLDAISPAQNASKIKAPLLVLQGANDARVPESESKQIVDKVRAVGGIAEYVLFSDEGHGFTKMPNRVKAYESIVNFLEKQLKGLLTVKPN